MKKYILIMLSLVVISLTGCGKNDEEIIISYQVEYDSVISEEGLTKYEINEQSYEFLLNLTGRSNNAKYDSYYVVLSNDKDITFEDVDNRFWSSNPSLEETFCIVEYGLNLK